jgi:hypothetical protein
MIMEQPFDDFVVEGKGDKQIVEALNLHLFY